MLLLLVIIVLIAAAGAGFVVNVQRELRREMRELRAELATAVTLDDLQESLGNVVAELRSDTDLLKHRIHTASVQAAAAQRMSGQLAASAGAIRAQSSGDEPSSRSPPVTVISEVTTTQESARRFSSEEGPPAGMKSLLQTLATVIHSLNDVDDDVTHDSPREKRCEEVVDAQCEEADSGVGISAEGGAN
jgi:hypothetical protein